MLVTKGALHNILEICSLAETKDGAIVDISVVKDKIQRQFEEFSGKGFRTLGIAFKNMGSDKHIGKDHESGMTFSGFLVLFDPLKPNLLETIKSLNNLGVSLKIITGDNLLVAVNVR